MSPVAGAGSSLSPPPDTCFVRYPSALNTLSDPNVSFRVNFSQTLDFGTAVPFVATRSGSTLSGSVTILGDTLASQWTATLCTTCRDSSTITSIVPDTCSAGGPQFKLTVIGSRFTSCSVVRIDSLDRVTTFVSDDSLTVQITTIDQAVVGTKRITVFTPTLNGGLSNGQTLAIVPPERPAHFSARGRLKRNW